ncbi:MAG: LacI family DNA-binding transcriptional regulator [Micropruina sp.]|uniref:LacI family DNA-binding transcriptional regulator n=1 Tax=Micropruina sp. TaxID=2737536 RepID=UPI0039E2E226
MATLSDVAARVGVSKSTVSRALSRPDLVAPGTVELVRRAADELNFVVNRAASGLVTGRTGVIAIVVPTLDNLFFTPIIVGAQRRAAAQQRQLTIAANPLETGSQVRDLERLARQVDGLILAAPLGPDDHVREVCRIRPSVLVDREISGIRSVIADAATAFGTLAGHLVDDGHRSLAYLSGPHGSWQDVQRARAIAERTAGRAELTVFGPMPPTFAAGAQIADDVVACGASAVIPYATQLGLGLVFSLRAHDLAAARGLVVTSESAITAAIGDERTPAIDVDGSELGAAAMELLADALDAPDAAPSRSLRLPVRVTLPGVRP